MTEKYGFVYIWFDKKRKRYYIGSHWGTLEDNYVCSSNHMRNAYQYRPETFKRRILSIIKTNRRDLLMEEQRWLYMFPNNQFGKKYYNLTWSTECLTSPKRIENLKASKAKRQETWKRKFAEGYTVHNKGKKNPEHSEFM